MEAQTGPRGVRTRPERGYTHPMRRMATQRSTKTLTTGAVVLLAVILGLGGPVMAQRRGAKAETKALEVELRSAARFGEVVVPAGRYRISVSKRGLSLAHPTTMVPVATLSAVSSDGAVTVNPATVEVVETPDGIIKLIVKLRERIYVAGGIKTEAPKKKRQVELASREGPRIGDISPETKTEQELIHHALASRYIKDVKHCADKAHRARWQTDDRRFWNCVCPLAERWRMPKVAEDLRVHFPLAKGKSGFSLTVTAKGRVKDCRVWVGAKPPVDETESEEPPVDNPTVAPSAAAAPAPTDSPPPEPSAAPASNDPPSSDPSPEPEAAP